MDRVKVVVQYKMLTNRTSWTFGVMSDLNDNLKVYRGGEIHYRGRTIDPYKSVDNKQSPKAGVIKVYYES